METNVSGLELLVEIRFEELRHLVGQAALDGAIDEVEGLRVWNEDPNHSPLDHAVEIARPRLADRADWREPGLRGGCAGRRRGGRLCGRAGRDQSHAGQEREHREPPRGKPERLHR